MVEDRLGERRVPSMFFTCELREISEMRREMIVASEPQQKVLQESRLKEKKTGFDRTRTHASQILAGRKYQLSHEATCPYLHDKTTNFRSLFTKEIMLIEEKL